jgi:nicotinamidase-related amidase
MKTTLLLIDIQNDYFQGGSMELEGSAEASTKAQRLLMFFREEQRPIVHVQHISLRPGATFFLPHTDGVNIHKSVSPREEEIVIRKHFPNGFRDTTLLEHLRAEETETLVICGMMTHMCVDATVRAAYDHGFECLIVRDACATKPLTFLSQTIPAHQVHASFLAALNGTYGNVKSTDEIISELS